MLIVAAIVHTGWLALTWWHADLPGWLVMAGGGWLLAWHGSLQHETIHGHPMRPPWLNALIGGVPLSLWLPYPVYRRTHLAHHRTPAITDPFDDAESRYLPASAERLTLAFSRLEAPLIGRLTIGPLLAMGRFLIGELVRAGSRPRLVARDWLPHMAAVGAVLAWLQMCGFSAGRYVLLCVSPAIALTLLRSFAEHRADPRPSKRIATVERAGALGLLYLNNNLHAAHHRAPSLTWYDLPAFHLRHRDALVTARGAVLYRGYGDVAKRYLLHPHDRLVHPDHVR